MEILGQEWWVQAIALTISLTGFYFWATGWYRVGQEYRDIIDALLESKVSS